ncbi:porin family protein [Chitinophaga varians]|uniref:porin family protein n=1 Tax=Chitinophaga varians TaxID=2202339 RepID=UPI00165FC90E|nr:porin family protein [Chitinophaga varians]MBC9913730.1 PorT family protein [Chitinophaga varians]
MKKMLFVSLAAMSAAAGAYAQKKVNFGLKGGLNISNNDARFDNFRPGAYAGGFTEIKLNKHWAVQPELVYYRNQNPGQYYTTPDDHVAQAKRKEDYISIPLMVKYYAKPKLYVEAGPEVNYLIDAKEDIYGDTHSIIGHYNRLNVSGSLGIGYQLPRGFGVNARYSLGVQTRENATFYNNTGKVGITYTFEGK